MTFKKGMCTIKNLKGQVIGTIPHSEGLYKIIASKPSKDRGYAAAASGKMSIGEAHRTLGHLAYGAISHAVLKGFIARIELDSDSKPEFCKAAIP